MEGHYGEERACDTLFALWLEWILRVYTQLAQAVEYTRPQRIYHALGKGHHFPIETFNKGSLQPSGNLVRGISIHHRLPGSRGPRNSPAKVAKLLLLPCLLACCFFAEPSAGDNHPIPKPLFLAQGKRMCDFKRFIAHCGVRPIHLDRGDAQHTKY